MAFTESHGGIPGGVSKRVPGWAFGNFLLRIFWQLRFKVGGCRQVKNHKLHLLCGAVSVGNLQK